MINSITTRVVTLYLIALLSLSTGCSTFHAVPYSGYASIRTGGMPGTGYRRIDLLKSGELSALEHYQSGEEHRKTVRLAAQRQKELLSLWYAACEEASSMKFDGTVLDGLVYSLHVKTSTGEFGGPVMPYANFNVDTVRLRALVTEINKEFPEQFQLEKLWDKR